MSVDGCKSSNFTTKNLILVLKVLIFISSIFMAHWCQIVVPFLQSSSADACWTLDSFCCFLCFPLSSVLVCGIWWFKSVRDGSSKNYLKPDWWFIDSKDLKFRLKISSSVVCVLNVRVLIVGAVEGIIRSQIQVIWVNFSSSYGNVGTGALCIEFGFFVPPLLWAPALVSIGCLESLEQ